MNECIGLDCVYWTVYWTGLPVSEIVCTSLEVILETITALSADCDWLTVPPQHTLQYTHRIGIA